MHRINNTKSNFDFIQIWILNIYIYIIGKGLSWSWSYDSWIYNYLCNQCLSPLRRDVLDTTLCDKVCQWLVTGRWFSPVSSTNKTDCHDIAEILLKVALKHHNPSPSPPTNIGTFWPLYTMATEQTIFERQHL